MIHGNIKVKIVFWETGAWIYILQGSNELFCKFWEKWSFSVIAKSMQPLFICWKWTLIHFMHPNASAVSGKSGVVPIRKGWHSAFVKNCALLFQNRLQTLFKFPLIYYPFRFNGYLWCYLNTGITKAYLVMNRYKIWQIILIQISKI